MTPRTVNGLKQAFNRHDKQCVALQIAAEGIAYESFGKVIRRHGFRRDDMAGYGIFHGGPSGQRSYALQAFSESPGRIRELRAALDRNGPEGYQSRTGRLKNGGRFFLEVSVTSANEMQAPFLLARHLEGVLKKKRPAASRSPGRR